MGNNPGMDEVTNTAALLIVDDEPVNVKLLQKLLDKEGYQNHQGVTDPREVLGLCQQTEFDLILLDINMPHLDGYQVMEQLQAELGEMVPPIIILTAQHSKEFRLKALEYGARDFLTKPFDRTELVMRVRNMLEVQLFHKGIRDQKALLEELVQQRTKELHDTRLEIVRRLGRAAEYRDNETGMHIIRMSKYAELLGRAAGLDERECDLLLNAAPMHDIGKIGIPDKILLKPGRFEPDEYEVMKTHTTIGAEILSGDDSELLLLAREIAMTHHERWDGMGYPNGLSGEDIPLQGRICAIADVFDALTAERPYKKAWSVEDAVGLLKEQSGKQFDPALIGHFLALLPQILEIRATYQD